MLRKFVKDSSWVLGATVLGKVINFLTLGFLTRGLNPESFGYYNAVQNTGSSINMMSSFGAPLVIQRIGARIQQEGMESVSRIFSTAFTLYILINSIAALILVLFPGYFFHLLLHDKGEHHFVYFISLAVVFSAANQFPLYLLLGLEEFRKYAWLNFVNSISLFVFTCCFILLMNDNLEASMYAMLIAFFPGIIMLGIYFRQIELKYKLSFRLQLHLATIRQIFSNGFIYYFGNTFLVAMSGLITISLFYQHLEPLYYGYLRIGNAFAILFSLIPAAIQPVTISVLAHQHVRSNYLKSFQTRWIPFLSAMLLVFLAFNIELIVTLLFGKNYLGSLPIVFGTLLLQILNIYLGLLNTYQVGKGHMNYVGVIAVITFILLNAGYFGLLPRFGIRGYFGSLYFATLFSLVMMAKKEFSKEYKLSKEEIYSILLVFGMLVSTFIIVLYLHGFYTTLLTPFFIIGPFLLFWKKCIDDQERGLLVKEIRSKYFQVAKLTSKTNIIYPRNHK